jgi:tRNA 5-methylaminomethyl-2-thiouridine biosynthesis bifunctional protein
MTRIDIAALRARWAGRCDFTVAAIGHPAGPLLQALLSAWQADRKRPDRLHLVIAERQPSAPPVGDPVQGGSDTLPPTIWPLPLPGLHRVDVAGGAVQVLLAWGPVTRLWPQIVCRPDAFEIEGGQLATGDHRFVKALARAAQPSALLHLTDATPAMQRALRSAGFESIVRTVPTQAGMQDADTSDWRAVFEPQFQPRVPKALAAPRSAAREAAPAVVLGAGLAGASVAFALAARGFEVLVIDRHEQPAEGSSGNPAGLFHGTVHAEDGPYAQLFRAAALRTAQHVRALDAQQVPHNEGGLLRLETRHGLAQMQALVDRQNLPSAYVQALSAADASRLAGTELPSAAWFFPSGGWVSPTAWVKQMLQRRGIRFLGGQSVQTLRRDGRTWLCLDADGRTVASTQALVLANAQGADALLHSAGAARPRTLCSRGQITQFTRPTGASVLHLPVSGAGYVLQLDEDHVLCGATDHVDDDEPRLREADHRHNLERLAGLCTWPQPGADVALSGRVGWRVQAPDRLPLCGPVPAIDLAPGTRLDQPRLVPREPGLHLAIGYGGRGITLAPLLGELVAARIAGTVWPVAQNLAEAVDPARTLVRAARQRDAALKST